MDLLGYSMVIEGLFVITYGLIRGGVEVRRLAFAGSALVLAYFLPGILGIAPLLILPHT
ncbi:hypothetical protein [Vulcanisaeta distributa]|uniref:hypothetical protein n=1 Tax=Vulcanisaeta distributa TaxID=164451 RepID=UPI001FB48ECA|nr:hypothetical protein [Vulcanisaeta distributa]